MFMYVCVCLRSGGRFRRGWGYDVVPEQLNPSNFKKNKHSLEAQGKLGGAETSGKIKSLVAPSLV